MTDTQGDSIDNADELAGVDLSGLRHRGWTDIRGWVIFDEPLPAVLQQREDAAQHNDFEQRGWRPSMHRIRAATAVERLLLTHLGFLVPPDLETVVRYPSGGVWRRVWPALQRQFETMTGDGQ